MGIDEANWMKAIHKICMVTEGFVERVDMLYGLTLFIEHGGKIQ